MDHIFEFKNYNVPVTIGDHQFEMDCSADTNTYIKDVAAKMRELADEVTSKKKTNADVQSYCIEVIDTLLGPGAAQKALGNRNCKSKTSDLMDLCTFLVQVATKFKSARQECPAPTNTEK